MTTTTVEPILAAALSGRRLVDHPFYRRWEQGKLRFGELTDYANQYRHFESALPSMLAELAGALPTGPGRDAVVANRDDELGPPSHLELFERFAAHFGADGAEPSPAMRGVLDAYAAAIARSASSGLAGMLAYEAQGAEVARSKADGLLTHYGASSDAAEFWERHAEVEDDHARWLIDAIDVRDEAEARAAATSVAAAWWRFLDERELVATP